MGIVLVSPVRYFNRSSLADVGKVPMKRFWRWFKDLVKQLEDGIGGVDW